MSVITDICILTTVKLPRNTFGHLSDKYILINEKTCCSPIWDINGILGERNVFLQLPAVTSVWNSWNPSHPHRLKTFWTPSHPHRLKTFRCFQRYFNAASLVMFEWIAMFMSVSSAVPPMTDDYEVLHLSRIRFPAISSVCKFDPRFYVWPIQWIENNYCLLPVSFPWLARPLKSDTLCHKVFLCPIQINRNFSIACMVLFASYHPEISNLFLWCVAHVRCLRFPIVSYICKFNPLWFNLWPIQMNQTKSLLHYRGQQVHKTFSNEVFHKSGLPFPVVSNVGQFDPTVYPWPIWRLSFACWIKQHLYICFKQHFFQFQTTFVESNSTFLFHFLAQPSQI